MNTYDYEVTGDYKESLKMCKNGIVIHDGSLIGLITHSNDRLELRLNYGKEKYHFCEIKTIDDVLITVPIKEYLYQKDYMYIPLIFTQKQYQEIIEISYIDRELLERVRQVNKEDIYNLLMLSFNLKFNFFDATCFKNITDNIIAYSEYDQIIPKCIATMFSNENVSIKKIEKRYLNSITLFIDYLNNLYEWTAIFKYKNNYYFNIDEEYMFEVI